MASVSTSVAAQTFVFDLRGDQVVPPTASTASGGCFGQLDQPGASFSLTCVHNVVGATTMQIRNGAAGANGATVFDLGDPSSPVVVTWTGMTPANIADVLAGNLYVLIQSTGRPAGEIRGQILSRTVDVVNFTADGAQVVPPNASAATANCTADLDGPATSLAIQCTHTVAGPASAHVHEGPFGTTGPAAFTFPSPASPLNANMPMTPLLVAEYAATFLYLDIHTAGTDEIRGQIGTPPVGVTTGTIVIEKMTAPAGGVGFGFTETITPGSFSLDHGQMRTFSALTPGTYSVTEDDPSASNYSLGDVSCDDTDSSGNVNTRTATINVAAGETVRCTFRNVETAPTDTLFVFHLSGDQEVPPVVTPERGGCMGRFDAAASELTLVCTHDVASPTMMHIHRGAPGVNGVIVFDLGSPVSPVIATWSGMTPADVADLMAGNFYVNIHSSARPGGAIRGQMLTRTVDTVSFTVNGAQVVPPNSSAATASCVANLDNAATALAINCTHNLAAPNAAHVHQAPRGANGPIAFTFPSAASPLNGNMPMTPRLVADFAATFLYLDIHTAGTEQIRGQIAPSTDVVVTKTGPATVVAGNNISWVITVTNNGPTNAADVVLTDALPAGTTFVSIAQNSGPTFNCTAPGGAVTCTIATLAPTDSATFTATYQVPVATAGGTVITNTASASSSTPDSSAANNSASASSTVSGGAVDLAIAKTAPAPPHAAGGQITYTISVSNAGPAPAAGVTVTDVLPAGAVFVSATPSQGSCSGTTTITCALGTIAGGGTATIALTLTLPSTPGLVSNTASVTTSNPDTNPANNSGTATVTTVLAGSIPALSPVVLLMLFLTIAVVSVMKLRG